MKRLFDLIFSLLGLVILLPVFIPIAGAIMYDSRGGVFFRHQRTGRYGRMFGVIKFRTMRADSGLNQTQLTVGSRDPRITRVGYYLRKYKLDELPQLINVFAGEMSFVGPRPEVKKFTNLYTTEQRTILNVRPGITDYASIKFRNESDLLATVPDPEKLYIDEIMPEKLRLNLQYIDDNNVFKDVLIIINTVYTIVRD